MALAGAIGFSIGYTAYRQIIDQQITGAPNYLFIIGGIIGGTLLGAALGYLEKRRAETETPAGD